MPQEFYHGGRRDPLRRTTRQGAATRRAILTVIRAYRQEHGYSPTMREIADRVGITAVSAVSFHLSRLIEDGKITMDPGIARSIIPAEEQ